MDSVRDERALPRPGFPIRKSPDQSLLSGSPRLIAAGHVLHRLSAPRHPPCSLSSFTATPRASSHTYSQLLPNPNCQRPAFPARRNARREPEGTSPIEPVPLRVRRAFGRALRTASLLTPMELIGIEPTTSGLQNRRSPN